MPFFFLINSECFLHELYHEVKGTFVLMIAINVQWIKIIIMELKKVPLSNIKRSHESYKEEAKKSPVFPVLLSKYVIFPVILLYSIRIPLIVYFFFFFAMIGNDLKFLKRDKSRLPSS